MHDLLVTLLNPEFTFSRETGIALIGILLFLFVFWKIRVVRRRKRENEVIQDAVAKDIILKESAINKEKTLKQLKEERLRMGNQDIKEEGEEPKEEPKEPEVPEKPEESEKSEEPETEAEDPKSVGKEEIYPYKRKMLLTKTEYAFYQKLKAKCDENKYIICPKVRLEDIAGVDEKEIAGIVPDNKKDNLRGGKQRYRNHVKSSHIDFVICNSKLYLLAGLELDDKSHFSKKASDKDEQKNKIFNKIGLLLFRIPVEPEKYDEQIDKMLQVIKDKQKEEIEEYIKKKQMQDGGKALSNSFAPHRRSL